MLVRFRNIFKLKSKKHLLITTVDHMDFPAKIAMSIALVVDKIGSVSVWSPLNNSRLALLAIQGERALREKANMS